MKLIIMRHGEAEPPGVVPGGGDFDRRLTATGRSDMERMARLAAATGWRFDEIRTSPLVRTRETGALIEKHLAQLREEGLTSAQPGHSVEERLAPGFDLDGALDIFNELDSNAVAIWIFHAPDVQRLSAALLGVREDAFYFTPGAMLALNLRLPRPAGRGMIIWNAQPEYLRAY
ncbi:MAG: histidine phosphatase family protein [bacterium]|nr:histidine phosphatase family protein [bacterium]